MARFDEKTAIVTGGGTGIGLCVARRFFLEGANVVICGRREQVLREAARQIASDTLRSSGQADRLLTITADITSEQDVQALVVDTVRWKSRIDVLVNNAAAMRINKPPESTSLQEWRHVIDANITGTFLCCRETGKVMIGQRGGKIINISSLSGHIVNRYFHGGAYEVSKAAVMMLTRVLAAEWAPYHINVNTIAPGYYDTEPNRAFFAQEADLYQKVLDLIPMRRLGNLDELVDLILVLASDSANYMTGSTITVDGGYTVW
jgi:NAD(P)-dependent dehydrogenase (short-subunit alcohol dehydrogenase family)